jgi:SAM-dependent methyltransferase
LRALRGDLRREVHQIGTYIAKGSDDLTKGRADHARNRNQFGVRSVLQLNEQLPAKVLKRMGQLRRLGARGLVHTAYVRLAGPAVYSLTDQGRAVARGLHRQRVLGRALPIRLERLKRRAAQELHAEGQTGAPGVRQVFEDPRRFVQALETAFDLAGAGCAVPPVTAVDWKSLAVTWAFNPDCSASEMSEESRKELAHRLQQALIAIHRAGYVLDEIGEDSVLFSGGNPVIVGLSHAIPLAGLSRDMSIYLRDADRRRFNSLFGTRLLTADRLRKLLSPNAGIPHDELHGLAEVYAPVVIRDDIRWGKIWNTDLGTGRWNFIMKDHLPIPRGGSVLDLGSNNGFNPLQMLRAGAASAVGIEIHEPAVEQAIFLKSAYEWLDNRSYDFRCILGSHGDLPSFGLPRFDVVTALCSLYYLPDAQVRDLVRYIRTRTEVLVLQCNTDRLIDRGGAEETYRKASVEFAVEMLQQAGFTQRQIIAPPGYSRPLVIGRA